MIEKITNRIAAIAATIATAGLAVVESILGDLPNTKEK